jgi:hypothetical protein
MTRWQTYVVVRGQRKDVDEIENTYFAVHDDTVYFDLNSVVPMPAEIAGGTEAAQIAWRMENWGCSGNAYAEDESDLSFDFLTDDGPPEKVFAAMARQFPRLTFTIYSHDMRDSSTWTRRDLGDGRIIAVHKVTELDAEIRERIRPDMTDQEKRQLAERCACRNLFPEFVWLEAIEGVICESLAEEVEAQNPRPGKVLLH